MEKDVIRFKDFLGDSLSKKKQEILSEILSDEDDDDYEISERFTEDEIPELTTEDFLSDDIEVEDMFQKNSEDFYQIYNDKNENFICDIHIEGASIEKSEARLIIESEDWNLMIQGRFSDGKCIIPLNNLKLLPENQCGKIRLEVIAEGNVIIPWEKSYKVVRSKKVSVGF
jgi:hypothetical protein